MTALVGIEAGDAELVELATAGDRDAFRQLFDRHAPRVAAACRQKTRSEADVDDAVQEAFARALANLDQLRNPAQFGAWVRSIAIRACLDHHRAARRLVLVDDASHAEHADSAPLPDEIVEAADRDASVRGLLSQLGERDRRALFMRHVNESAVPVIANELGLTEGSTRVMLTRARERLRLIAAGLGSFVPWSWRRWLREHLPASAPAIEAIAMVMVVGVAGGFSSPPAEAPRSVVVRSAGAEVRSQKVRPAPRVAAQPALATSRRAASPPAEKSRTDSAPSAPPGTAAPADDRHVISRVRDSVQVEREYPAEDESNELLDVTAFANQDEHTVRLYGNDVTDAARDETARMRDVLDGS